MKTNKTIVEVWKLQSQFDNLQNFLLNCKAAKDELSFCLSIREMSTLLSQVELHVRTNVNHFGEHFPSVLFGHVFSWLPLDGYYLFQTVCKGWYRTLTLPKLTPEMEKYIMVWINKIKNENWNRAFSFVNKLVYSKSVYTLKNVGVFLMNTSLETMNLQRIHSF